MNAARVALCLFVAHPLTAEVATQDTRLSADAAPGSTAASTDESSAPDIRPRIEHYGQLFQLAGSTAGRNCETDEYTIPGEMLDSWSQLVTVQRLRPLKATGTDAFLSYFRDRLRSTEASLEILRQSPDASVFAVRFARTEQHEEQVMICLAMRGAREPGVLNIIQYAIKPHALPLEMVEARIRSWRDKFLRQTEIISGSPSANRSG